MSAAIVLQLQIVKFSKRKTMLNDEERKPKDYYNIVYLITMLHGIGILIPWNMFITIAPSYFVGYKLLITDSDGVKHETKYSLNFFSYIGVCSQLPNLLLSFLNIFVQIKGGLQRRIIVSLIVIGTLCLITVIFALIDTSSMVAAFFFITIFTVVLLNAATGIYQNSLYGIVASFPPRFTNAIVLGNNVCGLFVSIVNIITLVASNSIQNAAVAYFSIALFTIIACFVSFIMLPKFVSGCDVFSSLGLDCQLRYLESFLLEFYNYYIAKSEIESLDEDLINKNQTKWQIYCAVLKKIWVQCFNVFFVFFVTLAIFPAIMADVRLWRSDGVYDFFIPEFLFTPITTFLLFNTLASIGSAFASFVQWPSPRYLVIPVVLRLLLLPAMMFCNYRPNLRTWPVLITNEYIYFALGLVMSFTCGYFSSLAMMYAPRLVEKSKASIAGMISAFFLIFDQGVIAVTRVFCGIASTFAISYFTDHMGPQERIQQP
ncbi:unnamed protein product [Dracunculus medinensis]|uniref:Equilibrative nucleoside transporter 1 n=1 Tax=Dracunculus medinensis TaxID=318479 RepID=A0A0N4UD60_DRAME|nr:unnamed protein product [Dracunculus medinensis]